MKNANSSEFKKTEYNVIDLMPGQKDIKEMGATMRLGAYPCVIQDKTKAYEAYKTNYISERHRHRYEVNNHYVDQLEKAGLRVVGLSADRKLVEIIEIPTHPWFVACQFHPEFTSTPHDGHPLFGGFIAAAGEFQKKSLG